MNFNTLEEASELINLKAGFEISNSHDLINYLEKFINDNEYLNQTSQFSKNYVLENSGSSNVIYLGLSGYLN